MLKTKILEFLNFFFQEISQKKLQNITPKKKTIVLLSNFLITLFEPPCSNSLALENIDEALKKNLEFSNLKYALYLKLTLLEINVLNFNKKTYFRKFYI